MADFISLTTAELNVRRALIGGFGFLNAPVSVTMSKGRQYPNS